MQWWAWIVGGAILLGAELLLVDAQFYLVFIGGAALLVGLLGVAGLDLAPWLQWLAFILIALAALLGLRRRIYRRLRGGMPVVESSGIIGQTVQVPVDLAAGAQCRLEFRGSTWDAVNADTGIIAAGTTARIDRVEGLILHLRRP